MTPTPEALKPPAIPIFTRQRRARLRRGQRRAYMAQNPLWLAEYEHRMQAAYDRWWRIRTGRNRRTHRSPEGIEMAQWILILMLVGRGNGTGVAIESIPMTTKAACEAAGQVYMQGRDQWYETNSWSAPGAWFVCIPAS